MIIQLKQILGRCLLQIMPMIRNEERKPLSFSTTMRNPKRIAGFISCLIPFENQLLTSELIHKIVGNVIKNKLYKTMYENSVPRYKMIFVDEDEQFSDTDVEDIIANSPQKHKEAGFSYGWDSRFDTWFKLPMEFGFVQYAMNKPLRISNTGHMLIDAYQEIPINNIKIQNVFLNALMKYQSSNPFRRNANDNVPLILLLNLLKLLKEDPEENGAGISRQEIPILFCWQNNNYNKLYSYIKENRKEKCFNYSNEFIYERCLELLEADNSKRNRFKMSQICGEAVDEYIRKMRSTGIISLRGNGKFIDINTIESDKIEYIINNYTEYTSYSDINEYYSYMGNIDSKILDMHQAETIDLSDIRKQTLLRYAEEYSVAKVFEELNKVCNKRDSVDPVLKFINEPTRLEFLVSIALVQQFKELDVNPNYSVDDEGLPTFTAGGGVADIECYDNDYNSYYEVTLMRGRAEQVNNEIIPIRRHLIEAKEKMSNIFSVFIAPIIHADTKEITEWYKHKDNIDILTFDINQFIEKITQYDRASQLLIR